MDDISKHFSSTSSLGVTLAPLVQDVIVAGSIQHVHSRLDFVLGTTVAWNELQREGGK